MHVGKASPNASRSFLQYTFTFSTLINQDSELYTCVMRSPIFEPGQRKMPLWSRIEMVIIATSLQYWHRTQASFIAVPVASDITVAWWNIFLWPVFPTGFQADLQSNFSKSKESEYICSWSWWAARNTLKSRSWSDMRRPNTHASLRTILPQHLVSTEYLTQGFRSFFLGWVAWSVFTIRMQ